MITPHLQNLLWVYSQATASEIQRGLQYYDWQRNKVARYTGDLGLGVEHGVGAFCVLSPNNSENGTYSDLARCVKIVRGEKDEHTTTTASWPVNKIKALKILRGADPVEVVKGRKVTAFYHNTLDPEDNTWITIDGHLYGVWAGERVRMKDVPHIGSGLYTRISDDIRIAAERVGCSGPKLQSTLWLTWKRIHKVLYSTQLEFCW